MTSAPLTCRAPPLGSFPSEIMGSVVRQCHNVTHLAIHYHDLLRLPDVTVPRPNAKTHAGNGDLHIFVLDNQKRQYSRLPSYNSVRTRALFSRITHLRLGDILGAYSQVPIRYMPRLTHVAVPYFDDDEEDLNDVVSDVFTDTSVEILVLVLEHKNLCKTECRMVELEDARVYVVMQLYSKLEMEWEAERAVDYTQLLMDQWSRIPEAPTTTNDAARPYLDTDSYYIGTTGT
ncbi:hypothetical protein BD779DRAFT_1561249 [Infundibulicybe gibba]|nr:hypothetical protein BD779DRAFT_1561249 [Infundibulicybe gibba]